MIHDENSLWNCNFSFGSRSRPFVDRSRKIHSVLWSRLSGNNETEDNVSHWRRVRKSHFPPSSRKGLDRDCPQELNQTLMASRWWRQKKRWGEKFIVVPVVVVDHLRPIFPFPTTSDITYCKYINIERTLCEREMKYWCTVGISQVDFPSSSLT